MAFDQTIGRDRYVNRKLNVLKAVTQSLLSVGGARGAYLSMHVAPNPFSVSTTLRFLLPSAGSVRATVLDITGRIVGELVNGYLQPGEHGLNWSGRNSTGAPVPPGVYQVQLQTALGTQTRRVVRMR